MSTLSRVEKLQRLIDNANATTGKSDADLTTAQASLIEGYGQGGGGMAYSFAVTAKAINPIIRSSDTTISLPMSEPIFTCALITAEVTTTE